MREFVRSLRSDPKHILRQPGLLLAFLIAEGFYKFHSFALECAAFLLTWLVIDLLAARLMPATTGTRPGARGDGA